MNKIVTTFAASIALSLCCGAVASPALAASAHNSQIGADGPTADPYSSGPTKEPVAGVVDYKKVDAGGKAALPCSSNDLKTELERKACD